MNTSFVDSSLLVPMAKEGPSKSVASTVRKIAVFVAKGGLVRGRDQEGKQDEDLPPGVGVLVCSGQTVGLPGAALISWCSS